MSQRSRGISVFAVDRLSLSSHREVGQWSAPARATESVLSDFLQSVQPWSREQSPVPRELRRVLWALIPVQLLWGIYLATIVAGNTSCDGRICALTTLNHHPLVLLTCAAICVTGLAGLVPFTRGLSRCGGRELVGLVAAVGAGGVALLGIVAFLIGVALVLIVVGTFVFALNAS